LSRQSRRYTDVAGNLQNKEVRISESERLLYSHVGEMIEDSGKLTKTKRAELRGVISTKPSLDRYLRVLLRTDAKAIKAEENPDGKYLLCCSDPHLLPMEIALGYKQVERGRRDLKRAST
jgi:hypothetical protein